MSHTCQDALGSTWTCGEGRDGVRDSRIVALAACKVDVGAENLGRRDALISCPNRGDTQRKNQLPKTKKTSPRLQPPGVTPNGEVMGQFGAAEKANIDIILAMQDANSAARFVPVGNAVTMTLIA